MEVATGPLMRRQGLGLVGVHTDCKLWDTHCAHVYTCVHAMCRCMCMHSTCNMQHIHGARSERTSVGYREALSGGPQQASQGPTSHTNPVDLRPFVQLRCPDLRHGYITQLKTKAPVTMSPGLPQGHHSVQSQPLWFSLRHGPASRPGPRLPDQHRFCLQTWPCVDLQSEGRMSALRPGCPSSAGSFLAMGPRLLMERFTHVEPG